MAIEARKLIAHILASNRSAVDEKESIRTQTAIFNRELAKPGVIDNLFPRQGSLNELHVEKLLRDLEMSQLARQNKQPPPASDVDDGIVAGEVAPDNTVSLSATTTTTNTAVKKVEELIVPISRKMIQKQADKQAKKKDADVTTEDSSDNGNVKKPKHKKKHDDDAGFDEQLDKVAQKTADKSDDEALGSKDTEPDSVDLDLESSYEDDSDSILASSDEEDDIAVDDEVAKRLGMERKEIEKKVKTTSTQLMDGSGSSDDESDFGLESTEDEPEDDGADDENDDEDADIDDKQPAKKKAKRNDDNASLAMKKKKTSKSKRDDADDPDGENAKKKKRASTSALTEVEKNILQRQKKRKAERRGAKKNWVTEQVLKDMIVVACYQLYRSKTEHTEKKEPISLYDLILTDTSNDESIQSKRLSLQSLLATIAASLALAQAGNPEPIREIIDFVRNTSDVQKRDHVTPPGTAPHTQCGITGLELGANNVEMLVATHYAANNQTIDKVIFAAKDLFKLIESVAFLSNFQERCEAIVLARLRKIKGYHDGKTTAAEAAELLMQDQTKQAAAHIILRTALRVHLDVVDMSVSIFNNLEKK